MTDDLVPQALRVARSPVWRWLPGMLDAVSGQRVVEGRAGPPQHSCPDLSDRLTLAAMEELVMQIVGADEVCTEVERLPGATGLCRVWALRSFWMRLGSGQTRAEAIVDAILRQEAERRSRVIAPAR